MTSAARSGRRPGRILIVVIVVVIAALLVAVLWAVVAANRLNDVEVQAEGAPGVTMVFADDTQTYREVWPSAELWWQRYNTRGSNGVVLTVLAPEDGPQGVTCRILWNEVVVVEETSYDGVVICHFQAGVFGADDGNRTRAISLGS